MNNTNLHAIPQRLPVISLFVKLSSLTYGCLSLTHLFSIIALNTINHILLKSEKQILWTTFLSHTVRVYLQPHWRNCPQSYRFGRVAQKRPLRQVIHLVPIQSPYATSYQWLVLTYILSRTVSKLLQIIGQISAVDRGISVFNTLIRSELLNSLRHLPSW